LYTIWVTEKPRWCHTLGSAANSPQAVQLIILLFLLKLLAKLLQRLLKFLSFLLYVWIYIYTVNVSLCLFWVPVFLRGAYGLLYVSDPSDVSEGHLGVGVVSVLMNLSLLLSVDYKTQCLIGYCIIYWEIVVPRYELG